jgi:penicillin-binding protein 1A
VESSSAKVRVGGKVYPLPISKMDWAAPYARKDATNDRKITSATAALKSGFVVWVKWAHRGALGQFREWVYTNEVPPELAWVPSYKDRQPPKGPQVLALEQTPLVQGALYAYDHENGYVVAMVGGNDFDRSEFNRAVQACRQPGSTYKPVYYSLALDRGYGFGTMLNDVPRAEVDPITGEVWTPTNLNNEIDYQVTLERSLTWSKNIPSVQIFGMVGAKEVEAWARRLGFTTQIIADKALALGASCVRVDEMARAFSAFARNGALVQPIYIRRIVDAAGNVIEDNSAYYDPMLPRDAIYDRLAATAGDRPKVVIPPRTAWLTSTLLERVVSKGHSGILRAVKLPAAGKTGTSSATMDEWFVGYTSKWMTAVWVGDDLRERMLGFKDASYMQTVPTYARFLHEVAREQPLQKIPWERPEGVKANDQGGNKRAEGVDDKAPRPKPSGAPAPAIKKPATGKPPTAPSKSAATPGRPASATGVPRAASGVPAAASPTRPRIGALTETKKKPR